MPMTLSSPSGSTSPTRTATLVVPISSPTIRFLSAVLVIHFLFVLLPANCHSGVISKIHISNPLTGFDDRKSIDKPLQSERNIRAPQKQLNVAIQGQFPGMAGSQIHPQQLVSSGRQLRLVLTAGFQHLGGLVFRPG